MRQFRGMLTAGMVVLAGPAGSGQTTAAAAPKEAAEERPPAEAVPEYQPQTVEGMLRIENKGYFLTPSKWPRTTIPVCWESSAPRGPERQWVQDAVTRSWQAHSALRFVGWGDCAANAAGIRIAVRDLDKNDGPHTINLGRYIDSKPAGMVLNFTFKTWSEDCAVNETERQSCIRSIGVHEFGHAIGFAHEHNRPDTPGECRKKPQGSNGDVLLTPWDPKSVMNYCNKVYNNDGVLSEDDIVAVRKIYGS